MRPHRVLIAFGYLALAAHCFAQQDTIDRASQLELEGKFGQATAVLTNALAAKSVPNATRKQLEFELDRLDRIRKDHRLTQAAMFKELKESVKDVTEEEFERWIAEGRFDSREIDGERRFMNSSVSNLYFRYAELETRRLKPKPRAEHEQAVLAACQSIRQATRAEGKPYVLPKRFRATMIVTVKADAAPDGEIIRAWLPIPRRYPFQADFELRSASPPTKEINSRESVIRAAYLERAARQGKPTEFKIAYDYTAYGVKFDVKPEAVRPCDPNDAALTPFLREGPHVVFTPEIRALSAEIIGAETNDFRKAKMCFDWIGDQIKYSFATEYSTIRNLSEYCRTKRYGDCGQEALLFITLCRLNDIPARWQSGWNTFPGGKDIHDWTEIYLAPYGWIPVDPYMAIWAMRYARTLTPEQQRQVRDFYFGGLDQWRMIANGDHSQELSPPKRGLRSDTVDFQRGELEWDEHNIYFDQYSYDLQVKEVKLPKQDAHIE
jgi:transglutaminase-like putative cysteine protease